MARDKNPSLIMSFRERRAIEKARGNIVPSYRERRQIQKVRNTVLPYVAARSMHFHKRRLLTCYRILVASRAVLLVASRRSLTRYCSRGSARS